MTITKCDVCKKSTGGYDIHLRAFGDIKTKEDYAVEHFSKDICSGCYLKFKKEITRVLSPFADKTSKATKK